MLIKVVLGAAWLLTSVASAHAQPPDVMADVQSCLLKPKLVVQIGSPVFGMLGQVFVDRTDRVQAGQLIAKLNTRVEEAQLSLDRFRASNQTQIDAARTDLAWNERELERRRRLAGNMFSKANEMDESITKIEQAKIAIRKAQADIRVAELEALRSQEQLDLKLIRSPINGAVSEVKLSPGEFIYEQTPIMTLVQFDPLVIDLSLSAERYRAVRVGTVAQVVLSTPVNATVEATVDAVDPIIDAASDTFRVRLALPNPDNAIPAGVRCTARMPGVPNG